MVRKGSEAKFKIKFFFRSLSFPRRFHQQRKKKVFPSFGMGEKSLSFAIHQLLEQERDLETGEEL